MPIRYKMAALDQGLLHTFIGLEALVFYGRHGTPGFHYLLMLLPLWVWITLHLVIGVVLLISMRPGADVKWARYCLLGSVSLYAVMAVLLAVPAVLGQTTLLGPILLAFAARTSYLALLVSLRRHNPHKRDFSS